MSYHASYWHFLRAVGGVTFNHLSSMALAAYFGFEGSLLDSDWSSDLQQALCSTRLQLCRPRDFYAFVRIFYSKLGNSQSHYLDQ